MSDQRDEQRLRSALGRLRRVAPSDDEVAEVLRRVAAPTRRTAARAAAVAALCVVLALGVTLTLPPGRAALAAAVDRLESFFGGGNPPGESLPPDEPPNLLNWLDDASVGSPRVLAQQEALRLVAYRDEATGHACFSLGREVSECGDIAHWELRFADRAVLPLMTTRTDSPRRVALWGVTSDAVAEVELVYSDRPSLKAAVGANGFVLTAPARRAPVFLLARDKAGVVIARADVADLQWRFCPGIRGCR